ncbi:hypothetical protein EGW08_013249, partial [Elysia chlorotica]
MDRLNVTINYSLEEMSGGDTQVLEKFTINRTSGEIRVVSPLSDPQVARLVILAVQTSGNPLTRTARASLRVTVLSEQVDQANLSAALSTCHVTERAVPPYFIMAVTGGVLLLALHSALCVLCVKGKGGKRARVSPLLPPGDSASCASIKYDINGSTSSNNCSKPANSCSKSVYSCSKSANNCSKPANNCSKPARARVLSQDQGCAEGECGAGSHSEYSVNFTNGSRGAASESGEKVTSRAPDFVSGEASRYMTYKNLPIRETSNDTLSVYANTQYKAREETRTCTSCADNADLRADSLSRGSHEEVGRPGTASISDSLSSVGAAPLRYPRGQVEAHTDSQQSLRLDSAQTHRVSSDDQRPSVKYQRVDHDRAPWRIHQVFQNIGQVGEASKAHVQPQAEVDVGTSPAPSGSNTDTGRDPFQNMQGTDPPPSIPRATRSPNRIRMASGGRAAGHRAMPRMSSRDAASERSRFAQPVSQNGSSYSITQTDQLCDTAWGQTVDLSLPRPFTAPRGARPATGQALSEGAWRELSAWTSARRPSTEQPGSRRKKARRNHSARAFWKRTLVNKITRVLDSRSDSATQTRAGQPHFTWRSHTGHQRVELASTTSDTVPGSQSGAFCRTPASHAFPVSVQQARDSELTRQVPIAPGLANTDPELTQGDRLQMDFYRHVPHGNQEEKKLKRPQFELEREQQHLQQEEQQQQRQKHQHGEIKRNLVPQRQLSETSVRTTDQQMMHCQNHQKQHFPQQHQQKWPAVQGLPRNQQPGELRSANRSRPQSRQQRLHSPRERHGAAEEVASPPGPSTAPDQTESPGSERDQVDNLDLEKHVRNWVNST